MTTRRLSVGFDAVLVPRLARWIREPDGSRRLAELADDPHRERVRRAPSLSSLNLAGNPPVLCEGPAGGPACGRVQSADLFVFFEDRHICDACRNRLLRTGLLDPAKVDPQAATVTRRPIQFTSMREARIEAKRRRSRT